MKRKNNWIITLNRLLLQCKEELLRLLIFSRKTIARKRIVLKYNYLVTTLDSYFYNIKSNLHKMNLKELNLRILTVKDVVELTSYSRTTIWRLNKRGLLPGNRLGKRLFFDRTVVENLLLGISETEKQAA